MLARLYLILGSLVLLGYGLTISEGWELGNPVRMASAPIAGSSLRSTSSGHWYWFYGSSSGGRGSGVGGFGGK